VFCDFATTLRIKASERCTSLFRKVLTLCAWFVPADLQIKEVCNTEHAPVSVKVDALQFRPNLVLSGSLPNDEDNWVSSLFVCLKYFKFQVSRGRIPKVFNKG
jgi:hypothetical protein